jgi:GMP synthase-like glutamine amidotransferase
LVVSHDPDMVAGLVGTELSRRGVDLETFVVLDHAERAESVRAFPDASAFDLLVVMGSPWSVFDPAISSWIGRELDWLRQAQERRQPLLAICFGAQALSAALGGTVERAPRPEIGWFEVDTTAPDLIEAGPWMQWHHDRFSVPPGARSLASSAVGPQAFSIGRSLAVQFHPEVDPVTLDRWLGDDAVPDPALDHLGLSRTTLRVEAAQHHGEADARAGRLVERFLAAFV